MNILGVSGSLRQKSFNTALLAAAEKMMPAGSSLTLQTLHGIPLYNADEEEASGFPPAVLALQKAIYEADALLIATPEYNNSIPGVLKNAIDWVSRPSALSNDDSTKALAFSTASALSPTKLSATLRPLSVNNPLLNNLSASLSNSN